MAMRKAVGFAVAASLLTAVCTSAPPATAAEVSGTGKGIAGGALIGGEIGFMGLAAFGARQSWMYAVIPGAFAIGGGVGGYFIEKSASPEVPLAMLAGGMALIIPTVVITLSATSYQPGSEDSAPSDASPADAGATGGVKVDATSPSTTSGSPSVPTGGAGSSGTTAPTPPKHKPSPTMRAPKAPLPFALFNVSPSRLEVALPVMHIAPTYSRAELDKFGLAQRYEVRAPLVSVAF